MYYKLILTLNKILLYQNKTIQINLKHLKNGCDKHTDIQFMKVVKESDKVILAQGAYAKNPVIEARVNEVLEMLKPHKKKVKQLVNPVTKEIMHPLNPKARSKWTYK